jgi:hypothetical protein
MSFSSPFRPCDPSTIRSGCHFAASSRIPYALRRRSRASQRAETHCPSVHGPLRPAVPEGAGDAPVHSHRVQRRLLVQLLVPKAPLRILDGFAELQPNCQMRKLRSFYRHQDPHVLLHEDYALPLLSRSLTPVTPPFGSLTYRIFNVSEICGNVLGGGVSALYYWGTKQSLY